MSQFYYFMVEGYNAPLGYLHSWFVENMTWPSYWQLDHSKRLLTLTGQADFEERIRAIKETLDLAYEEGRIPSMRKRVNEAFAVYAVDGEHVLDMEFRAVESFGIVVTGVHLITYVMTSDGRKYWIQ